MSFESIYKGYPYDGIKSKELFPNRPFLELLPDGKVSMSIPEESYPDYFEQLKNTDHTPPTDHELANAVLDLQVEKKRFDFVLNRLWDFANALVIAEQQVNDLLHTYPFVPEDFDFVRMPVIDTGANNGPPVKIYQLKDGSCGIMQDPEDGDYWYVIRPGKQEKDRVRFPHFHFAYAYFVAIGVHDPTKDVTEIYEGEKMSAEEAEELNAPKNTEPLTESCIDCKHDEFELPISYYRIYDSGRGIVAGDKLTPGQKLEIEKEYAIGTTCKRCEKFFTESQYADHINKAV